MIHQYRNNGYNIVMDVESGSIHVVDDIVYDMVAALDEYSKTAPVRKVIDEETIEAIPYDRMKGYFAVKLPDYDEEEISEAYEEIAWLVEEECLFTDDSYEDYIAQMADRETVVKALCLHIAHDCNLA